MNATTEKFDVSNEHHENMVSPKTSTHPFAQTGVSIGFAALGSRSRPVVDVNVMPTSSTNILIENHVKRVTSASKRRLVLRNNNQISCETNTVNPAPLEQ